MVMERVLVVDEDAQLLTILKEDFKKYRDKFEVITAKDGLAAIMALKEEPFSLVVTEIRIPIVNGLVLLAYIRKNYPKTPCIVMTGHGTPFLKRRLEQEAAHYIEKPFRVRKMARTIMSALGLEVAFGGIVKGIPLVGFVQLIEMERLTCLCEISAPEMEKGYLVFDQGVLHYASHGHLRGEAAALRVLQVTDATIRFRRPPKKNIPREIETRLSFLLTEAMRVNDEHGSVEEGQLNIDKELEEVEKELEKITDSSISSSRVTLEEARNDRSTTTQ
jgi:CheY-like chemotaxis protein